MSDAVVAAGAVKIIITGEGASFSAAVAAAKRDAESLGSTTQKMGHTTISSMQAASGAIRLLEGDITRNVRAVERFVTMIPGIGAALKTAFPIVGALALGGVIARLGKEVYDFIQNARQMPQAISNAWRDLNTSSGLQLDELHRTNDELQNQINKLEGKPQNNLAIALDDARINADKLARSLEGVQGKIEGILKEKSIGFFQAFITGQVGTGPVSDAIKSDMQTIADLANQYRIATKESGPYSTEALQAHGALLDKEYKSVAEMHNQIADIQKQGGVRIGGKLMTGDTSGALSMARGYLAELLDQIDLQGEQAKNSVLAPQLDKLKENKEAETRQMETWRRQLEAMKAQHTMTLDEEAVYWQKLADSVKRGSPLYNAALQEANKARAQSLQQFQSQFISETVQNAERIQTANEHIDEALTATWIDAQKRDEQAAKQMQESAIRAFEAAEQQQKTADRLAEESVRIGLEAGRLTPGQAVLQLQAIHQESFARWSEAAQSFSSQFPNVALPGAAAAMREYGMQSQQDEAAVEAASSLGRLRLSTDQLTTVFLDSSAKYRDLLNSAFGGVNNEVVNALSGRHTNFGNAGADIFRGVANLGLQIAEGSVLSVLGFGPKGKPDGTQSNPLYVRLMQVQQASSSLLKTSIEAGGGSGVGSLLPTVLSFLPGFASGGPIPSNMPAIVGENGPELFMPSTSGTIVPNGAFGNTSVHHTINVDARGAGDPSAVKLAIDQAMRQYIPHIVRASINTQREINRRVPPSMKR